MSSRFYFVVKNIVLFFIFMGIGAMVCLNPLDSTPLLHVVILYLAILTACIVLFFVYMFLSNKQQESEEIEYRQYIRKVNRMNRNNQL